MAVVRCWPRCRRLQVDNFAGRLGGAWQADALIWQQDDMRVELQQLDMAWSPSCLLRLTLCLDRLHLRQVGRDPARQWGGQR